MGAAVSGSRDGGRAAVCLVASPLSKPARTRLARGTQARRGPEAVSRLPAGTSRRVDAGGGRTQRRPARRALVRGSEVPRGHARWPAAHHGYGSTTTIPVRRRSDELVSGAGDVRG